MGGCRFCGYLFAVAPGVDGWCCDELRVASLAAFLAGALGADGLSLFTDVMASRNPGTPRAQWEALGAGYANALRSPP